MKNFTQIPNSVIFNTKISDGAFRTYVILRSFKFYNGKVFPPQQKISELHGTTKRTIHSHIKELKRLNLISYKRRGYSGVYFYSILDIEEDNFHNERSTDAKGFSSIRKVSSTERGNQIRHNNTNLINTELNNTGIENLRKTMERLRLKVDLTKNK